MAQPGGDSQEKNFDPTPRKLEQARERGDLAVSTDLHAAASYLGFVLALSLAGASAAGAFGAALQPFLGHADQLTGRILGPGGLLLSAEMTARAAWATIPLFALPALGAIVSLVAQRAVVVAGERIEPKLSRIDPISIAGHKFGAHGLAEFLKSAVKMALIGAVLWWWLAGEIDRLIGLAAQPGRRLGIELGETLVALLTLIAVVALAIGFVDLVWQRYQHFQRQRMSLQELRDETKETEGDPGAKQERKRRAEAIAANRMLLDVPKADVVIVNPTHYAVALKWSRKRGEAPICVAKGVDEAAARIRARAAEAGVPIHRDPPTARMLHATVDIGRQIRPEHFRAVAAAFRFAEAMRGRAKAGGAPR